VAKETLFSDKFLSGNARKQRCMTYTFLKINKITLTEYQVAKLLSSKDTSTDLPQKEKKDAFL
jgi:hypothetical protein